MTSMHAPVYAPIPSGLKASNVIGAAAADLKLREAKRKFTADDDKPYSFARQHVRKAQSVGHLIAIAFFEKAPRTDKRSTMIIYNDRAALSAALIEVLHD
jgi:hypothetical protein